MRNNLAVVLSRSRLNSNQNIHVSHICLAVYHSVVFGWLLCGWGSRSYFWRLSIVVLLVYSTCLPITNHQRCLPTTLIVITFIPPSRLVVLFPPFVLSPLIMPRVSRHNPAAETATEGIPPAQKQSQKSISSTKDWHRHNQCNDTDCQVRGGAVHMVQE